MDEVEKLKRAILEKTGMSSYELEKLIEKRIKEFAGLLTELGALYTIAKDHGVEVDIDEGLGLRKKIKDLKPGDRDVSVVGRVVRLIPPRKIKKNGRKIKYAVIYLYDGTGEVRLVLWGKDADLVGDKIRRGSVVEVINGKVEEFRGSPSLSLGYSGRLLVDPEVKEPLPDLPKKNVGDVLPGDEVELELEVVRSFPVRRKGDIVYGGFIGRDETGEIRVVLWGSRAVEVPTGSKVKVIGVVKEGRSGKEIHVSESGFLEVLEAVDTEFADVRSLEERIAVRVFGTIVSVYSKKPFTGKCNVCGGEVEYRDGRFVCSSCGSEDVSVTPMLVFALDDGTGVVKVVLFGDVVRSFCPSFPEGCVEKLHDLLGRYLVVSGEMRRSKVTGTLDLVGRSVSEPDFYEIYDYFLRRIEKSLGELPERGLGKVNKEVEGSS